MLDKIKICGINDIDTLDVCINIGIGFLGFNFVQKSPRYISPLNAHILCQKVPQSIKKIALCVDENDETIEHIISTAKPDFLQLHGHETIQRIIELKSKFNISIIKAIGVHDFQDIEQAKPYFNHVDMMLFDAKPTINDALTGGLGKTFNWTLVKNITSLKKPFMLAGGLNSCNIKQAQQESHADYFDICSGVEEKKGIKSIQLIKELQLLSI